MSIKWSIAKDSLEGALRIIDNVPARNGIKASEYIRFRREDNTTTSVSLSSDLMARAIIRGDKFPFKSEVFLDRRLFIPFVDAGREAKSTTYVFIKTKAGELVVKHGNRKASYEFAKEVTGYEDYPTLKDEKSTDLDKRWMNLVDAAKQCATDDPITPHLNCVYINPTKKALEIYASNTRVVFKGTTSREQSLKEPIAFPLMLVDALQIEGASKLTWTKKMAVISFAKGKIWQAVKITARKNYPLEDHRKMVENCLSDEVVLSIQSSTLSGTANRIAAYVAALSREDLIFSIKLEKGSRKVTIESGTSNSKFQETLSMLEAAKKDVHIEWPLLHVMPALLYCKDDGIAKIHMSSTGLTCLSTKTVSLVIARKQLKEEKSK